MAFAMVSELRTLDPMIWKACAGSCAQIPIVDSKVYYFPQGHAEQSSSPLNFSSLACTKPFVLCRIVSVRFLANPDSDEVFVKIRLQPIDRSRERVHCMSPPPAALLRTGDGDGDEGEETLVSFVKILTPSDANNGGGFSVPRFCADSVFPPLNYKAAPPVQTISVRDVHGVVWEFRHIYRGTPRRHLLTTGWSKFVNQKKLVAGDSVVFIKNRIGELFIGVRRTARSVGSVDCLRWNCQFAAGAGVKLEDEFGIREGFWRSSKGRVPAESILEAAELAGLDMPFEILYYPGSASPDFVVKAETVEDSLNMFWTAGTRVKMAVETEDSSRMTWFQGTVSLAAIQDHGPWHGSPWRMLQVTWDEPESLQNVKRVNPWQVELVASTPPLHSSFPPTKKCRVYQNPDLPIDGEGALFFPKTGLTNSVMRNLSPSLFNYYTFPVGMQGARHDSFCVTSLPGFIDINTHHMLSSDHLNGNVVPKLSCVSTKLNIGSTSQSDNSSPNSQSSVHFFGTELFGSHNKKSTTKSGGTSFQLFGKIIQTNQPFENGFDDTGCSEDDGSKEYKETEGEIKSRGPSISYPYNKPCNGLDAQCQEVSVVEACSL